MTRPGAWGGCPTRCVLAGLTLVIALTGCQAERPAAGLRLDARDYRFEPRLVPVTANQQVTLRVTNRGRVTHNLSIPSIGADTDLRPGKRANVIFVAPASGEVEFFCKIHRDRGMTGSFQVRL